MKKKNLNFFKCNPNDLNMIFFMIRMEKLSNPTLLDQYNHPIFTIDLEFFDFYKNRFLN